MFLLCTLSQEWKAQRKPNRTSFLQRARPLPEHCQEQDVWASVGRKCQCRALLEPQAYLGDESHIPRQVGKQTSGQLLGNLVERKCTAMQLFEGSETEETRKGVRFFSFKFQVVANLGERKRGGERCEFCFFKKIEAKETNSTEEKLYHFLHHENLGS